MGHFLDYGSSQDVHGIDGVHFNVCLLRILVVLLTVIISVCLLRHLGCKATHVGCCYFFPRFFEG